MDDLESRVATTLVAVRDRAPETPASLAGTVHRAVRRRRRRRAALAGGGLAAALIGLVAVVPLTSQSGDSRDGETERPATTSTRTHVGVLPDGTRYELRIPARLDIGTVEGISGVPVWATGTAAGDAVGVTRYSRVDMLPPDERVDETTVVGQRLIAPAGSWALVIDLYTWSIGRKAELETIEAREQDGLIVLDLPASLRFAELLELPSAIEVSYSQLRVVRGCRAPGVCSADRQVMVESYDPTLDLSGVQVRTLGLPAR